MANMSQNEDLKLRVNVPDDYGQALKKNFGTATASPQFLPCSQLHPFEKSCVKREVVYFLDKLPVSAKLAFFAHILPGLLINNVGLLKRGALMAWLRKVCPEFFRSTLALVLYGVIFGSSMCALRRTRVIDDQPNVLVSGFLAATTFLLEPRERRIELVKFLFKDILFVGYNYLHDWSYPSIFDRIENGKAFLFALSMAFWMYYYQNKRDELPHLLRRVFLLTFGEC